MQKILIFIACVFVTSCTKDNSVETESDKFLTTSKAKQYYENFSKTQQYTSITGELSLLSAILKPSWESSVERTVSSYSMVEVPINILKNEISIYQLNGESTKDNLKRSKFSLSRMIIYKDLSDSLKSYIITYIPDIAYIDKGKDISENTFFSWAHLLRDTLNLKKSMASHIGYCELKMDNLFENINLVTLRDKTKQG
jgi:hypothetical protein